MDCTPGPPEPMRISNAERPIQAFAADSNDTPLIEPRGTLK